MKGEDKMAVLGIVVILILTLIFLALYNILSDEDNDNKN